MSTLHDSRVVLPNGVVYVKLPHCDYGDYGGSGDVGLANIRVLRDRFGEDIAEVYESFDDEELTASLVIQSAMFDYECAWMREDMTAPCLTAWMREDMAVPYLTRLESYPALDDEAVSEVDLDWEDEAWRNWLRDDLIHSLPEELQDAAWALSSETQWMCYVEARDAANVYPVPQYSGVYVDVDALAPMFADRIEAAIGAAAERRRPRVRRTAWKGTEPLIRTGSGSMRQFCDINPDGTLN